MQHKKDYPEYKHYLYMLKNCNSPCDNCYTINSIQITPKWLGEDGFWVFLKDVGAKPSDKHKLIRKDLKKGYYKDNCEWFLSKKTKEPKKQTKRRPQREEFKYKDKMYNIASFCREFNLDYKRTYYRITEGWDLDDVINEPNQREHPTRSYLNKFHPNYKTYQRLLEEGDDDKIEEFFERIWKSVKR